MSEDYSLILKLLQEVRDEQQYIITQLGNHDRQLTSHVEQSSNRHLEILKAFPNGDTDGHRRYHEAVIEWSELRNRMVREALLKCAGAGAVAGAGYLIYAIGVTIKMYFASKGIPQ